MANSKRSGGLGGRSSFFNPTGTETVTEPGVAGTKAAAVVETPAVVPTAPAKADKIRLTVTVYPKTLAALEQLKVELRKGGHKVTMSDVLEEATWALIEKKKLTQQIAATLEKS